jgi:hypothetical protein
MLGPSSLYLSFLAISVPTRDLERTPCRHLGRTK